MTISKKEAIARYHLANSYCDKKKYEEAIQVFSDLIKMIIPQAPLSRSNCRWYRGRAAAYLMLKNLDAALADSMILFQARYYKKEAHCTGARIYIERKDWDKAISSYKEVLKEDPKNPQYHYLCGQVYLVKKEPDQAIIYFSQAIDIQEHSDYYINRISAYFLKKQFADALGDANKLIKLEGDASNYNCRGCVYYQMGKYLDAYFDFTTAIKLCGKQEDLVGYYKNRAAILGLLRLSDDTIKHCSKVIELNLQLSNPIDVSNCYYVIGKLFLNQLKIHPAIAYLLEAIKLDSTKDYHHFYLGCAYTELREWNKAITCFSEAIKLNITEDRNFSKRGECLYELKQYNEALSDFTAALEINPENTFHHLNREKTYKKLRRWELASLDKQNSYAHRKLRLFKNDEGRLMMRLATDIEEKEHLEAMRLSK
jgi:tetratricopeptide (TPR) repeat protein